MGAGAIPRASLGLRLPRWLRPLLAVPTPAIFLAAAAVATLLLWRQGSLETIAVSLRQVPIWQPVAILAVYAGSILLLGVRWHVLVRLAGGLPAWTLSTEVFLTSVIVNYAAPIGLAVPTRAALTVRDLKLTPSQSGAVVGWELVLDVVALAAISAGWLLLGGMTIVKNLEVNSAAVAAAATAAVLALGAALALFRRDAPRKRLASIAGPLLSAPRQKPAAAFAATLLTAVFWATQSGIMAALLLVFGVSASPSLVMGLMGLPMLIGMLSPVPGGAGVREALMAAAAGLEGVPAAPVVLAAVSYRLALFVVTPVVWGGLRVARASAERRH